jgi:hypothetical protein
MLHLHTSKAAIPPRMCLLQESKRHVSLQLSFS